MGGRGFSLLELMVVLGVVGILLSAVLPAYRQSLLMAGRSEARELLLRVAADQALYYTAAQRYSLHAAPLRDPPRTTVQSPGGRYRVSVAGCDGGDINRCFVATAIATGAQSGDSCTALTLSSTGARGASGDSVMNCWR